MSARTERSVDFERGEWTTKNKKDARPKIRPKSIPKEGRKKIIRPSLAQNLGAIKFVQYFLEDGGTRSVLNRTPPSLKTAFILKRTRQVKKANRNAALAENNKNSASCA